MVYTRSEPSVLGEDVRDSAKIIVVGDLAVGKTTLIGSVSEIPPLRTEETMTRAGVGVDALPGDGKTTTTVGLDFGRRTLPGGLALYLFGAPGQRRFWAAWPDLARGAVGALILIDTRRLEATFDVLDEFEDSLPEGMPHAVVVNVFPGTPHHPLDDLRDALRLEPQTPLSTCDARSERSSLNALTTLTAHSLAQTPTLPKVPS